MNPKLVIIVPYFQREPGLLARALASVNSQTWGHHLQIIVVDDGSPTPADQDIGAIDIREGSTLTLHRQTNAGPGAARNAGLGRVSQDIEFVAFLDSDDQWRPNHLENAYSQLAHGADLYFSNVRYFDEDDPRWLERCELIRCALASESPLSKETFIKFVLCGAVQTSSIVYRIGDRRHLRFPEEFRFGEDQYFWISLALSSSRISGSSETECDCGKGINIFRSNRWGAPDFAARAADQLRFHKTLKKLPSLPSEAQTRIDMKLAAERLQLARALLHDAARGRLATMISSLQDHPEVCASLVPAVWKALRRAPH